MKMIRLNLFFSVWLAPGLVALLSVLVFFLLYGVSALVVVEQQVGTAEIHSSNNVYFRCMSWKEFLKIPTKASLSEQAGLIDVDLIRD